jgi:hypothetical protein
LKAVRTYTTGRTDSIIDAWDSAIAEIFPGSLSSQTKGCPRGTFLGVCESGVVVGVPGGQYTKSAKNKAYGLKAVATLRENPHFANDVIALWKQIMNGESKFPNHQMDVVTSLWKNGLLKDNV